MANEIDKIFTEKERRQKPKNDKIEKGANYSIRGEIVKNKEVYTEDGYKIYTEDELKIGKGGLTENCPIDCNCCF